ncbi:hypothetical protein KVH31_13270 [Streptomyces olivaceus]|uniref:hypothetical protein n=1 Tax=Streptomyces olivaceus TaxID=47716 RepID=UPI001CD002A9|nr:hypothetical protein [Streptomyces olivaceus]MBZ6207468.1 hypothetical protein [Streptomyces olivaceus]
MGRPAIPADAFDHGDPRRYRRGCKCRPCTTAITAEVRRGRYLRATGRGLLTTTHRAARHIARLRDAGMPDRQIMADALISEDVLYRIVRDEGSIHRATETRVLALKAADTDLPGSGSQTSGLGTVRRLRALAADGWTATELAHRCGRHKQFIVHLQNQAETVTVRRWVADYVTKLYTELDGLKPEDHGIAPHIAERTRSRAASKGWVGTAYWDGEALDDPDYDPAETLRELNFFERAQLRREEIEHLAWCGHSPEQIVDRLNDEVAISTVRQIVQEWRTGQKRDRKQPAAA